MKLLRQKITQLEEEKQVRTSLAMERDEANLTVRKLQKMIERLQKQLDLARETNTDLKAKLSETSELKVSRNHYICASTHVYVPTGYSWSSHTINALMENCSNPCRKV